MFASALMPSAVHAQDQQAQEADAEGAAGDITVTARRKSENLLDTPITISLGKEISLKSALNLILEPLPMLLLLHL